MRAHAVHAPAPGVRRPHARAPPIESVLGADVHGREFDAGEQARLVRTVSAWSGAAAGAAWTGILAGLLFGLGRVPVPEALLWSVVAGAAFGRVAYGMTLRAVAWLLEPVRAEVALPEPETYRRHLAQRARRWGLRDEHHGLRGARLRPAWAPERTVPPLVAEWVGAGARLSGPRFAVRAALRWAMP